MNKLSCLLGLVFVLGTSGAFAAETPVAPCSVRQLEDLEVEIIRWEADGYRDVYYLRNEAGDILGIFASDGKQDMYAGVCESITDPKLTVSNEWYYWDDTHVKSEPAAWEAGESFSISQDEGRAKLKVLNSANAGATDVSAELTIVGWDDNSIEHVVRRDIVTFQSR